MSNKVDYNDWDLIVQKAEANLEILDGNMRRAEVGEICEKENLAFALRERDKYPKPEKKKEVPKGIN